jgi:leucyl aminopeptidase
MFKSVRVGSVRSPECLVVGVFQPENGKGSPSLDAATKKLDAGGVLADTVKRAECTGKVGALAETPVKSGKPAGRIIVVGLGLKADFNREALRNAIATATRRIAATRDKSAVFALEGALAKVLKKANATQETAGAIVGETVGLVGWRFDGYRGARSKSANQPIALTIGSSDAAFARGLKRGVALATSANLTRFASATPPNIATPAWMASESRKLARTFDAITTTVFQGKALKQHKLEGLINVGQASINKPCLVRIAYKPARGANKKPIVLVGKTITYDTGGLSIKGPANMRGMKCDKDGGCAVLGAMHAIASVIKPNRPVIGLLAAAENSIDNNAYRPDDVITFRNGVTVEITNTDAEGRLVLADALCWACDKEKPEAIIDLATLTGGVVVALGSTYAGMWCDDDTLRARLELAAEASGERLWRLPHHAEYDDLMKSDVADLINSSPIRKAHPIQGAAFLKCFVKEDVPWCHIDIAGVSQADTQFSAFNKATPTAFGVRLLAEYLSAE